MHLRTDGIKHSSQKEEAFSRRIFSVAQLGLVTISALVVVMAFIGFASREDTVSLVSAQGTAGRLESSPNLERFFVVNVPAFFKELVTITALTVEGDSLFEGSSTFQGELNLENEAFFDGRVVLRDDVDGQGININLGSGKITTSNVIYSLVAGGGISISEGQTPTISATDKGSDQEIFKKIKIGSDTVEADGNEDTLELAAGSGISLSLDTGSDKVTITNSTIPGFVKSGTYAVFADGVTRVGVGTSNPSNIFELDSGSDNTSGFSFTRLTSSSPAGIGGGKVLSLDSGGRIILVADQTGDATPSAEAILPSATNGMTLYFNGTNWAASDNLFHDGGSVGVSNAAPTSRLHVNTNLASKIGLIVQGYSSQTANLQEWRGSDGTILSYVDANGVFNGSANTSGSLNPGFTQGSVAFQGASGLTQDNANFFWDDSNNRLGIGTASPDELFHVSGSSVGTGAHIGNAYLGVWDGDANYMAIVHNSVKTNTSKYALLQLNSGDATILNSGSTLGFRIANSEKMTVASSGNVGIGTTSPDKQLTISNPSTTNLKLGLTGNSISFSRVADGSYVGGSSITGSGDVSATPNLTYYTYNDHIFTTNAGGAQNAQGLRVSRDNTASISKVLVGTGSITQGSSSLFSVNGNAAIGANYIGTNAPTNGLLVEGSVGVGTTAPEMLFQVGNKGSNGTFFVSNDSTAISPTGNGAGGGFLKASRYGRNGYELRLGETIGNDGVVGANAASAFFGALQGNRQITIDNMAASPNAAILLGGNPGGGTVGNSYYIGLIRRTMIGSSSSPDAKLQVTGAEVGKALMILNETGNQDIFTASASGTTKMVLNNQGNLGLGTNLISTTYPNTWTSNSNDRFIEIQSQEAAHNSGIFLRRNDLVTGLDLWSNNSTGDVYIDSRYNDSARMMRFRMRTAGTAVDAMTILGSGNVGIGTTGPTAKLQVATGVNNPGLYFGGANTQTVSIGDPGSNFNKIYKSTNAQTINYNAGFNLQAGYGHVFTIDSGQHEVMRIDGNARVGINTATPLANLHVTSKTSLSNFHSGKALVIFDQLESQDIFTASASGTTRMVLTNSGNLGIGTSTPGAALELVGDIKFGNLKPASFIFSSTNASNNGGKAHVYFRSSQLITSGDYLLIEDGSNGTDLFRVDNSGNIYSGTIGGGLFASNEPTNNFISFHKDNNVTIKTQVRTDSAGYTAFTFNTANTVTTADLLNLKNNNSSKFLINASGNVGIGNTNPGALLHVGSTAPTSRYTQIDTNGILTARRDENTAGVVYPIIMENRDGTASIAHNQALRFNFGSTGDTTAIEGARIQIGKELEWTGTSSTRDSFLAMYTTLDGTAGEKMRIASSGNVGIGVTNPSSPLTVAGNIGVNSGNVLLNNTGNYVGNSTVNNYTPYMTGAHGVLQAQNNLYLNFDSSNDDSASAFIVAHNATNASGTELFRIDSLGNVGVGTASFGTDAAKVFAIAGSTAPTTAITDGAQLFAVDQGGSHELRVMDEAGNVTTLSPHNFSLTGGRSEDLAWSFYSERNSLAINADMTKALRLVEKLSGEKLVYLKDLATGEMLEDDSDATQIAVLAEQGEISGLAKWNYELWTFLGEVIFEKPVEFLASIKVNGKAVFASEAWFGSRVTFADKDMAGYATIVPSTTSVRVAFEKPFEHQPVVTITPKSAVKLDWFRVTEESTTGFVIEIPTSQAQDVVFSWSALAVENPASFTSQEAASAQPSTPITTNSTPQPSTTPSSSPTPTPVGTPAPLTPDAPASESASLSVELSPAPEASSSAETP